MVEIPIDQRDQERALIIGFLKNSINTVVYGPPRIGKTTLINSVIEEANKSFGQAIYVDCSIYPTANAVLREIHFCICLVADSFESYRAIDFRLRTKIANIVKIEKLSNGQVSEILNDYVSNIGDEIIQRIVEKNEGNLTLALNILKSIEANHGKSDNIERIDFSNETAHKTVNENHSIILNILKKQNKRASGQLHSLYCQKSEFFKSERSFRNYMQTLQTWFG